jgi:ABC-type taurine transport system substrate-binding protein
LCIANIFSFHSGDDAHGRLSTRPPPKAFEPTAIRETIGHKVDWRRFNNDPEMVSPAQQTTARRDDGTAKAIGERTKFLLEQGKVETVLPDYAPYASAKYVTE